MVGKNKTQNKFIADGSYEIPNCVNLVDSFFSINEISNFKLKVDPFKVNLNVENIPIIFEIDTGSAYSIISETMFNDLLGTKVMENNDLDYVGNKITPIGKVKLSVDYNNKTTSIWVYIVPNGGPPLLGRNDLILLGIDNFSTCNFTGVTHNVNLILNEYKDVFSDGLGSFNAYQVSLKVKQDSVPKFCKARPVPLALREKVENEIDRLVHNQVLVPVDHREWATPVVPIRKNDGTVRLCGDFKVTVNLVLVGTEYPLPKIEHLYAKISGARFFSKIDLKNAYQQLILDEESQPLTTINTVKGLYRYTRVPFGLKSSAGEFQKAIESITCKLKGVEVLINDIIVTRKNVEEHNTNLKMLLKALSTMGLKVKKKKNIVFFKRP